MVSGWKMFSCLNSSLIIYGPPFIKWTELSNCPNLHKYQSQDSEGPWLLLLPCNQCMIFQRAMVRRYSLQQRQLLFWRWAILKINENSWWTSNWMWKYKCILLVCHSKIKCRSWECILYTFFWSSNVHALSRSLSSGNLFFFFLFWECLQRILS